MWPFLLSFLFVATTAEIYGISSKSLVKGDLEPPQMEKFRVHGMKFCPFTERVLIYMAKKNFRAEVVNINLASKPEWYVARHKSGTVPTLQLVDVIIGRDSPKILELLDIIGPETAILPQDEKKRASEMQKSKDFMDTLIGFYSEIKKHGFSKNHTEETWKTAAWKIYEARETLLPFLRANKFLSGPTPGYFDYMVFPHMERIWVLENMWKSFLPRYEPSPEVANWFTTMYVLPEVLTVRQSLENHMMYFESVFNKNPNDDAEVNGFPRANEIRRRRKY